jgi:undecaprenyl phosphate-alpha-L-ara4N flippase subunit ArnE
MSPLATMLWAANLVCDVVGQLAFKAASSGPEDEAGFARWRRMLLGKWIWVGIGAFVGEFFLWIAFLSVVPLSLAVLVGSVDIVLVMIGGRIYFQEAITGRRALAAALISAGVVMVGWG